MAYSSRKAYNYHIILYPKFGFYLLYSEERHRQWISNLWSNHRTTCGTNGDDHTASVTKKKASIRYTREMDLCIVAYVNGGVKTREWLDTTKVFPRPHRRYEKCARL